MKLIGSSRSLSSLRTIASSSSQSVSHFTDCVGRLPIGI